MQVFVEFAGSGLVLNVHMKQSVYCTKREICVLLRVPLELAIFVFMGKEIPADGSLESCGIGPEDTIRVWLKLAGGAAIKNKNPRET